MAFKVAKKVVRVVQEMTITTSDGREFSTLKDAVAHEKALLLETELGEVITPKDIVENYERVMSILTWNGHGDPHNRKRGPRKKSRAGEPSKELKRLNEEWHQQGDQTNSLDEEIEEFIAQEESSGSLSELKL